MRTRTCAYRTEYSTRYTVHVIAYIASAVTVVGTLSPKERKRDGGARAPGAADSDAWSWSWSCAGRTVRVPDRDRDLLYCTFVGFLRYLNDFDFDASPAPALAPPPVPAFPTSSSTAPAAATTAVGRDVHRGRGHRQHQRSVLRANTNTAHERLRLRPHPRRCIVICTHIGRPEYTEREEGEGEIESEERKSTEGAEGEEGEGGPGESGSQAAALRECPISHVPCPSLHFMSGRSSPSLLCPFRPFFNFRVFAVTSHSFLLFSFLSCLLAGFEFLRLKDSVSVSVDPLTAHRSLPHSYKSRPAGNHLVRLTSVCRVHAHRILHASERPCFFLIPKFCFCFCGFYSTYLFYSVLFYSILCYSAPAGICFKLLYMSKSMQPQPQPQPPRSAGGAGASEASSSRARSHPTGIPPAHTGTGSLSGRWIFSF